jgi:tRNA G37 N-methylase TrmD
VVVQTLAQQLHLTADAWSDQYTRPNTLHDYQVPVVAYLGFHAFDGS